jgi:hypothetical protein
MITWVFEPELLFALKYILHYLKPSNKTTGHDISNAPSDGPDACCQTCKTTPLCKYWLVIFRDLFFSRIFSEFVVMLVNFFTKPSATRTVGHSTLKRIRIATLKPPTLEENRCLVL